MSAMVSQITSIWTLCSTISSGRHQRKHQSPASLAFERGIHLWPLDCPHKGPVKQKMFHLMMSWSIIFFFFSFFFNQLWFDQQQEIICWKFSNCRWLHWISSLIFTKTKGSQISKIRENWELICWMTLKVRAMWCTLKRNLHKQLKAWINVDQYLQYRVLS